MVIFQTFALRCLNHFFIQKSGLKEEISSAFSGLSSAESASTMAKFLTSSRDVYQVHRGKVGTQLWLDYFDILLEHPAAKMEENPEVNATERHTSK